MTKLEKLHRNTKLKVFGVKLPDDLIKENFCVVGEFIQNGIYALSTTTFPANEA